MTQPKRKFTVDELGLIQTAVTKVLAAAAQGELDLNQLAREELASRGMNMTGQWVGFERAAKIHLSANAGKTLQLLT